ncbi:MAG: hypothetical protein IKM06_03890, partial [Clostridia bacterium]|nr:hypothetical protein [Clostridia bacterium]
GFIKAVSCNDMDSSVNKLETGIILFHFEILLPYGKCLLHFSSKISKRQAFAQGEQAEKSEYPNILRSTLPAK